MGLYVMSMPLASGFISLLHESSLSALSPAALIAIGAVAGTAAIAFGISKAYKSYKHKKWQEHLAKMKKVNEIAEKTIGKISITPNGEYKHLPFPFRFDDPSNPKIVDSFHLPRAEIEAAGTIPKQDGLMALDGYSEKIRSALFTLKDYLQFRMSEKGNSENDDVTCSVLSHMIYLIETYAMNFQGFDWDIEYLDAIANYINLYASESTHEDKSQHFNRLADVYTFLNQAKDILIKSKENTSLAFSMSEIKNTSKEASRMLITILSKLILKNDKHQAVDNAPIELIARGTIRKEHIKTAVSLFRSSTVLTTHQSAVILPDSIFKEWIIKLAKYYEKSIDESSPLTLTDIAAAKDQIELDAKKIENCLKKSTPEFREIQGIFSSVDNFFTKEPILRDPNDAVAQNITISDRAEIIKRVLIYKQFALLCHQLISMTYLSMSILNGTKQLGEIYMKNPKHFHHMFDKFYEISNQIKSKIENIIKSMKAMDNNLMIQAKKQKFFDTIQKNLEALTGALDKEKHEINALRSCRKGSDLEQRTEMIHHISDIIKEMTKTFNLHMVSNTELDRSNPVSEEDTTVDTSHHSTASAPLEPGETLPRSIPHYQKTDVLLDTILREIGNIQANEDLGLSGQQRINFEKEIHSYEELYGSLNSVYQYSLSLKSQSILEQNDPKKIKANKMEELLRGLCFKTIIFMRKNRIARKQEVGTFYHSIQDELSATKELCEIETPLWKRVLEAVWGLVLCLTIIGGAVLLWKHNLLNQSSPKNKIIQAENTSRTLKHLLAPTLV